MIKKIDLRPLNTATIFISMISFILLWWSMVLIPITTCYDSIAKRFGLTLLLVIISKCFSKDLKIKLSEMYLKIDLKNLAYSLVGVFVFLFLFSCLTFQKMCSFDFNKFSLSNCIDLFFLGIYEEMFFRGWGYTAFWSAFDKKGTNRREVKLFNKYLFDLSELKAIVFTNLFFSMIHLQAYVMILNYNFLQSISSLIQVFFVGVFFTLIFRKTKSIWNVVIVHMFWDLILRIVVK